MRISDWSSDVCSSDLRIAACESEIQQRRHDHATERGDARQNALRPARQLTFEHLTLDLKTDQQEEQRHQAIIDPMQDAEPTKMMMKRSEEHTSELQSLMRLSYAVFCLKKKNTTKSNTNTTQNPYQENITQTLSNRQNKMIQTTRIQ